MIVRRALLGAVAAAALVTGCGTPTPVPTAPETTAPAPAAPQPTAPESPAPESTGPGSRAVAPPWPAADATELQRGVDSGSQPWLLDPSEVALAYASAAHGWETAQVVASSDGRTVDVTGPEDERRTLTLEQPGRGGPTGVWVVTTDEPTP